MYNNISNNEIDGLSLDIGCGKNKTSGFIGVDKLALPGVEDQP